MFLVDALPVPFSCLHHMRALPIGLLASSLATTGVTAKDVILDIGCGDGRVLVTTAKVLGCRGTGIDISEVGFALSFCTRRDSLRDERCRRRRR